MDRHEVFLISELRKIEELRKTKEVDRNILLAKLAVLALRRKWLRGSRLRRRAAKRITAAKARQLEVL